MITIRKGEDRGHANHGWLDTWHTFSFAEYRDEEHMGYRALRVINEDFVAPGKGFPTHGHRDMEIVTYVLEGGLQHKDDMGNGSVIRPGDVQRMSAGTGVMHSEWNASQQERVHLLQIWLLPAQKGTKPGYEERSFSREQRQNRLCLLASQDARDGSVTIHQDVSLYGTLLDAGREVTHELAPGRHAWLQVARGAVRVNDTWLSAGDGAALDDEARAQIQAQQDAELLLFDLA